MERKKTDVFNGAFLMFVFFTPDGIIQESNYIISLLLYTLLFIL